MARDILLFLLMAAGALGASASFDGSELVIANGRIERRWRVVDGLLYAKSFRDLRTGREWLARQSAQLAPVPAIALPRENRKVAFREQRGRFGAVEAESVAAELTAAGEMTLRYRFQTFPDSSGVRMELIVEGGTASSGGQAGQAPADPTGIEQDRSAKGEPNLMRDVLESLDLAAQHMRLVQVTLADQTDAHNELVFENEWLLHTAEAPKLAGNLFILEDTVTRDGLVFLKEAPLPHARPVKTAADFTADWRSNRVALLGTGYRWVTLSYSGGRSGRTEALQRYQRQLRVYDPSRDGMFLSNTWGDRSRDSRITGAFMTKEVEAGARLGADVIQIDDGWQQGRTSNSARGGGVWNGFWAADPNFWEVNRERFPEGLRPVVNLAAEKRMQFGLWFAPDSSGEFANWEKDAAKVLELHRTLGIRYFKIDGVKAVSRESEANLRRFFDRVLEQSKGRVTFDLDVTAETRPGYFGMMHTGPLFVENRYTDWHRYWPHQTLRNLWKLAQYVDPVRLRMEFLNNSRNQTLYESDPLAPAKYSPSCLFATAMFANPLGWFEMSSLPAAYFEELPPLIAAWKAERAKMFSGTILPIGAAPDGVAWTGFASVSANRRSGYVLVFRELNGAESWSETIPLLGAGRYRARVLGGEGTVAVDSASIRVRVPGKLGFVWARIEAQ